MTQPGRIGIYGASGSGKTTYAIRRIRNRRRMVIFNPLDDRDYVPLCKVTARSGEDVRAAMLADWGGFTVNYVPPVGREDRALSQLCKLLLAAQAPRQRSGKGPGLTLVVDELNMAFPVAGGEARCPGFAEVCSRGRHYGIEAFGITQRIAEVSTRWRGNTSEAVVFRQSGGPDVNAAVAVLGGHKPAVLALPDHRYLHKRGGAVTAGPEGSAKGRKIAT